MPFGYLDSENPARQTLNQDVFKKVERNVVCFYICSTEVRIVLGPSIVW